MLSIRTLFILSFLSVSSANAFYPRGKMVGHNECIGLADGEKFSNLIIDYFASDAVDSGTALWLAADAGYASIVNYVLENYEIHSYQLVSAQKRAEEKGRFETALVIAKNLLKRSQDRSASCWFCFSGRSEL